MKTKTPRIPGKIEAIIYCRVSSDRQKNEGHGLESQEQRCREYAKQHNYSVARVFQDSFTGGGDFMRRPAMASLMQFVDRNAHGQYVLIFDDMSRFARDVNEHFLLRQAFDQRGIELACPNFSFENTPEGELVETMMAAQHQYHRKNNKRQVVQKMKARLELGYWPFASKRGYTMEKTALHGKILTPYEPDASLLRDAFTKFASGEFRTKVEACRFLFAGGFWKNQTPERYIDKLTYMLEDPLYVGDISYPQWDVERRRGHHEGIVSLEVFEAVQKRLKQGNRGKRTRVDTSSDFPLRGLLVCRECGSHITAAFSKGTNCRVPYYLCQSKLCEVGRKSIRRDDVHAGFDKILKKQVVKAKTIDLLNVVFDRVWKEETKALVENEGNVETRIKKLEADLDTYAESAVVARSDRMRSVYEKKAEKCDIEIEELSTELIGKDDLSIPYRTALDKATGLLKSPYKIWHSVDVHEQQKLFHFIFLDKLAYSKKAGYRTDNLPSAVRLFEEFVSTNSHDVEMGGVEPPSELGCDCESTVHRPFFGLK